MKKIFFITLAAMTLLTGCKQEQDDFFSESSASRADKVVAKNYKILTSAPHGWYLKYFPSKEQAYGGYTFCVSFSEDGKVTFAGESDISGGTEKKATSLYTISQSAGVTLSLDTYNEIFSKMADPGAPLSGYAGEGLGGDNEFSILSACADSVTLLGRASGNHAVMYPMASDDWKGFLDKVASIDKKMFASSYTMTIGSDVFDIRTDMRGMYITYVEDGKYVQVSTSYIINDDGMKFYKPFEFKGHAITGFKLNDSGNEFYSFESNDVKLVKNSINKQFVNALWYAQKEDMGEYGAYWWGRWESSVTNNKYLPGEMLLTCFGYFNYAVGLLVDVYVEEDQDSYLGQIFYDYELIGDDQVKLTCAKTGDDYGSVLLSSGYNYGCEPFGYRQPLTFKLSSNNLKEYIDLECLTPTKVGSKQYTNNIRLFMKSKIYPLRNPEDREE